MIRELVDHTYLINLDRRTDMLHSAMLECNKIHLPFERISAVNGLELEQPRNREEGLDGKYWNRGALALAKTTARIIEDAKARSFKNILILEDDIRFNEHTNRYISEYWHEVPLDVQMFNFGVQHTLDPIRMTQNVDRVRFGFCCHCYMINETIYDAYLVELYKEEKQIDLVTCEDLQWFGTTYSFRKNMAYQKTKYSDINEEVASRAFLIN